MQLFFKDNPSPILYWKGFIRSMGTCYTYQKPFLIIDGISSCPMFTGAKMGKTGVNQHPWGGPYLPKWLNLSASPMCGGWPIGDYSDSNGRLLRCREGVSCRTSSHMRDSWYFPRFLLRDGSLIQMNLASFMVLVMSGVSLPTMEKQSTMMWCPVDWMLW